MESSPVARAKVVLAGQQQGLRCENLLSSGRFLMCDFLVLMVPEQADVAHAVAVGTSFGFRPERGFDVEPYLPDVWQGAVLLDPEGLGCYCGTHLGRAYREPKSRELLEQKARRGRRARWSANKQQKWLAQQLVARGVAPTLSRGADHELDRWLNFALAALEDRRIARIGVVLTAFHEQVRDWAEVTSAPASLQSLQMLPRRTPTWLV